jgi:hypothetical protein
MARRQREQNGALQVAQSVNYFAYQVTFGVIEAGPPKSSVSEYHHAMQVVTGTVVGGKVILEGVSLPEGTVVTILAKDSEAKVHLPPALQAELEEALEEADREEGISGNELLERLRKYG